MIRDLNIVDSVNATIYDTDIEKIYRIRTDTVVLTSNWAVAYSGTAYDGEMVTVRYKATNITLGGNTISVLGTSIPDDYVSKEYTCFCMYDSVAAKWQVTIDVDFEEDNIVTSDRINALAVTTAKINDLAVTTGKIAALAVDDTKLAANSVITTKILANNVTWAKIEQSAANTVICNPTAALADVQELAMGASTILARLAAGNIVAATVAQMVTLLNIPTLVLASTNFWVGNGGNVATAVAMSGDATMDNTGAVTIANSAVDRVMLNSAGISYTLNTSLTTTGCAAGVLTVLATYTMSANTMATNGDYVIIRAFGTTAANANAKTFSLEFGAAVLAVNNTTAAPNNLNWVFESKVYRTGAATEKNSSRITFNGVADEIDYTAPAIDTTANIVIRITGLGVALNDIVLEGFSVNIVRA